MGFLDTLGKIASGASSIGGIVSPAASLLGLGKGIAGLFHSSDDTKKQMKMQKELMTYQNDMNKANSLLDYQRQRQLTIDNAALQKMGMRQAGLNTALGDGSVASASNVGSTSSATPPSALPTQSSIDSQYLGMINDTSASLSSSALQDSQKQLIDSQRHSQDIKNAFEIDRQIAEIESLHKSNKISDAEYETRMENLKRLQDTHGAFVRQENEKANQAEKDTQIKDIQVQQESIKQEILSVTKQLNDEQLKQAQFITAHQFERFSKEMEEITSRIKSNDASAAASFASAAASASQKMLTDTQIELEKAKVPFASSLAKSLSASARNAAQLSYYTLYNAEEDLSQKKKDNEYNNNNRSSSSFGFGQMMRNSFEGWLPFSGSASVSKTLK